MHNVIIIAGGWSVSKYDVKDLRQYGHVVGVNDSAVLAQCHTGFSMDRLWAEHRFKQYFTTRPGQLYIRKGADKNLPHHPRRESFECCDKSVVMSDEKGVMNGTNSGIAAMNYAWHRKPNQLFLFGFDMQRGPKGESYWYPDYEWAPEGATKSRKYQTWAKQFDQIAKQFAARKIKVFNVNHRTKIESFEKIDFEGFLRRIDG